MSGETTMTYAGAGVSYEAMDPFKCLAQSAGRKTAGNIGWSGFHEVAESRGESVFLVETKENYIAHLDEGLGTKCLLADSMHVRGKQSYYDQIAQDTVAMIVNDMITLGAMPLVVGMHLAVGQSNWFDDQDRAKDLVDGWKRACDQARCIWGGGETPTLLGIVVPGTVVISGSATGIIQPKCRRIRGNIQHGDVILFAESNGIHANALTLARKIGSELTDGVLTTIRGGRTYGDILLDPTHIYVELVNFLLSIGIDIHYAVNVTGHGWRKLMRAPGNFTYVVDELPTQLPIFDFIQLVGPVSDREAYGNLNMGAGFALYMSEVDAKRALDLIHDREPRFPYRVYHAGHIEAGEKKVVIRPKGLEYLGETLAVR